MANVDAGVVLAKQRIHWSTLPRHWGMGNEECGHEHMNSAALIKYLFLALKQLVWRLDDFGEMRELRDSSAASDFDASPS